MFVDFDWMSTLGSSPILLVLGGCSMVSLAVALERLLYYRRAIADVDRVLDRAQEALRKSDLSAAIEICKDCPHPLGAVAPGVLSDPTATRHAIEEKIQILLSQQKLLLERNVGLLGTMAAIAPLIGLLGTVVGIMRAFHDMAQTGSAAPTIVAAGVAEALLTTAAGLVVAVPSVMLFNYFNRRMNVMLTIAENHTRSLRNTMESIFQTPSSRPAEAVRPEPAVATTGAGDRIVERVANEARDVIGNLAG